MGNMFEKYAADREAEQKKIEKTVSVAGDAAEPAVEEKRTTLSLSLTVSDKKKLKMRGEAHHPLAVADRER